MQFNLRDLAVDDELDQASIAHALHELNKLEAFTYVPPFRGRAIRMIRRDLPFDELEIDFEAQQHRKDAEYEKLERVVSFARSGSCRQRDDSALLRRGERRCVRPLRQLPAAGGQKRGERGAGREERGNGRERLFNPGGGRFGKCKLQIVGF